MFISAKLPCATRGRFSQIASQMHFASVKTYSHINQLSCECKNSYLHFGCFTRDTVLCSNFFCFCCFFMRLISFTSIEVLRLQTWTKSTENSILPKCQLRPCCIPMTKCIQWWLGACSKHQNHDFTTTRGWKQPPFIKVV